MKVSVHQREAVDMEEYGLQSDVQRAAVASDAAAQWESDEPSSAQQSLLELMRSPTDPKQYGLQSNMRKPVTSGLGASQATTDGRAALQLSTLGRIQSSTARQADALLSDGEGLAAHKLLGAPRSIANLSQAAPATGAPKGAGASAGPNGAPAANSTVPGSAELTGLLNRYEPQTDDAGNVQKMQNLQKLSLRGAPEGAAQFEATQEEVNRKIADLPQDDQDYFRGAQAVFVNDFENSDTKTKRDAVALAFGSVRKTLDEEHSRRMSDPSWRVERFFDKPYGSQYLDKSGQTRADSLEQFRSAFASAKDQGQRGEAMANAVALKHELQRQIGNVIGQSAAQMQADWKKSESVILDALKEAGQMRGSADANNETAFARLESFGGKVFTSESNARAFKVMQQEHPEKLAELGKWARDVADRTAWAQQAIQSDPFKRKMTIPDAPEGYLKVDENTIPLAHYGDRLLAAYQNKLTDVQNAGGLYHAAQEPGPIKEAYIRAHTPPAPEWQQELNEVLCRLTLGTVPIVGFAVDQICPRSDLSDDARKGIDIAGGLLGAAIGGVWRAGDAITGSAAEAILKGTGKLKTFPKRSEAADLAKGAADSTSTGETRKTVPPPTNASSGETTPSGKARDEADVPGASKSEKTHGGSLSDLPRNYIQPQPDMIWSSDRYSGLMEDRTGNVYVVDGKNVYAVKRDADNATWRVYDPKEPWRPGAPIQPNQDGGWELHSKVGLKGGAPGDDGAVAGPSGSQKTGAPQGESIEQTMNRWVADQDRKYASITQKYNPGQLNLKAFEHKVVKVSDEVFRTLTDAQKINEQINALMPYGSGNQHWDIQATGGESYKRVQVRREPPRGITDEAAAAGCGAGNCDEKAELAFRMAGARFKNSPVLLVTESGGIDHTYVLVGDPRDPAYGKSTVVVDPWPSFPTAHTTEVGPERPYLETAEASKHEPFNYKKSPLIPTEQIDSAYAEIYGTPADKDSVLLEIYDDDGEEKWVWTQRTSGNDVSAKYRSPSNPGGIVLDKLPDYIVERYDPYIQQNDDHNGPLFPASAGKSHRTT